MLSFSVTNIANKGSEIYLWHRVGQQLCLYKDKGFKPYFYQLSKTGIYRTIFDEKANKITCRRPSDVKRRRDENSYEADILYTKRYLIDRISQFNKVELKYSFIDIEVLTPELPNYQNPIYPVSCISCSNSYTGEIKTFYLPEYQTEICNSEKLMEEFLLNDFVKWIKDQQFDLLLGWNYINFDWLYLQARYKYLFGCELAEMLSPIAQSRYLASSDRTIESNFAPAGISILDYLDLFKKIYKMEVSYALDAICQKHLNESSYKKVDFSKLSKEIKEKNINDVRRMIELEKKFKIIEYYDELRRMSKCEWADVTWNSKIIDMMLLQEAKQKRIVLPSKRYGEGIETDDTFEGAYRRCNIENDEGEITERLTGLYHNIWKVDLSSAYPMAIINFCLDVANIKPNEGTEINGVKFLQNSNALLPSLVRKLVNKKDTIKKQLKALNPETPEYKDLLIKYDAIKAVVNSTFGVCGLKIFRLFDYKVAATITFLIRDLLHYVEENAKNIKIIYIDTDSIFCEAKENPTELLNSLVQKWAKDKYNKDRIDIQFDLEGIFEKLLIIALCHYKGYLRTKSGLKEEIKGVEIRRKDSSEFMKTFQNTLIEKILNGEPKGKIKSFINSEGGRIKTVPLKEIGFPCKISSKKDYKSLPIHLRALEYTQEINPNFQKVPGDTFYYIYVEPFGTAMRKSSRMKKNKETGIKELQFSKKQVKKDVLCFDEEIYDHIKNIDWKKIIERTIINKVTHIFEAMDWFEGEKE